MRRTIPRRRAPLEDFFLAFREIFSPFTHIVIPSLLSQPDSVISPPLGRDATDE